MESVISRDGTRIAYHCSGEGPPLVLVHGTGAQMATGWPAFPALEARFMTVAVQRRGRGESGDGPNYGIRREGEDIVAVLDAIGEPAHLLGHSFGGICVLEAAVLTQSIRTLILYEGIPSPEEAALASTLVGPLTALLDTGDLETLLETHYREGAGMSAEQIAAFRSSPAWAERVASAHTIPREFRTMERYRLDAERFGSLTTPTLLLVGGDSPPWVRAATEQADAVLPRSRIVVMPGQTHVAMYPAPDLFAR